MKFKQFLLEEQPDIEKAAANIKKHCQQFLKESKRRPLYRGQKTKAPNFYYKTKAKRENKDVGQTVSGLFNLYVEEKFHIPNFRNENVIFTNGNISETKTFGDAYYVFPVDGYEYMWSPIIRDFLGFESSINGYFIKALTKEYGTEEAQKIYIMLSASIKKNYPATIKDLMDDENNFIGKFNVYEMVHKDNIEVFEEHYDYDNNHLSQAISAEVEIMIRTPYYYAISVSDLYEHYDADFGMHEEVYREFYDEVVTW